ncbi:MAG TPA: hypothetical protein VJ385_09620 [Fibrobacteria bacterium]|nr:hypothetical protein [Fibrobacteria bacterium]
MMKMESQPSGKASLKQAARYPAPGGIFPSGLKISGHTLSLASDIGALEECLALERSSGPRTSLSEGIHSPTAVPYCDFLMLRSFDGALQAVCRLMRLDGNNVIRNPLASGRFHLAPLLTALRYSREGILEMGVPTLSPGCDAAKASRLLWSGMIRYLERNGLGFVIGRENLSMGSEEARDWPHLMEAHGLHPDLQMETRSAFDSRGAMRLEPKAPAGGAPAGRAPAAGQRTPALRGWPAGLQEALRRGCRLACEPAFNAAAGCLEFVWVASRDMLESGESGDWRGGPSP